MSCQSPLSAALIFCRSLKLGDKRDRRLKLLQLADDIQAKLLDLTKAKEVRRYGLNQMKALAELPHDEQRSRFSEIERKASTNAQAACDSMEPRWRERGEGHEPRRGLVAECAIISPAKSPATDESRATRPGGLPRRERSRYYFATRGIRVGRRARR